MPAKMPKSATPTIIVWKCAIRNKLLCTWKSAGGDAMSTPAMPPSMKVQANPINQYIGVAKTILPLKSVKIQLNTCTPEGIAISKVMIPKKELTDAPAPIVKKWCSHTKYERKVMAIAASTIEV